MATPSQPQLFRCMGSDEQCRLMYTAAVSGEAACKKQPEQHQSGWMGIGFLNIDTHLQHDDRVEVSKRQENDNFVIVYVTHCDE